MRRAQRDRVRCKPESQRLGPCWQTNWWPPDELPSNADYPALFCSGVGYLFRDRRESDFATPPDDFFARVKEKQEKNKIDAPYAHRAGQKLGCVAEAPTLRVLALAMTRTGERLEAGNHVE